MFKSKFVASSKIMQEFCIEKHVTLSGTDVNCRYVSRSTFSVPAGRQIGF